MQQIESTQNSQQWIVVVKNKNKHKGLINNKKIYNKGVQNVFTLEFKQEEINKFQLSKQFQINCQTLTKCLLDLNEKYQYKDFHVQCLGLGNFHSNKKAFIQFIFLQYVIIPEIKSVLNKKSINRQNNSDQIKQTQITINIYDPVFTKSQHKQIQKINKSTSQQKYKFNNQRFNIFFMPHCQRNLYQAVLQQYFNLNKQKQFPFLIIGNSIQGYKQRLNLIKQKIPQIFNKIKLTEIELKDYQNALNDTFILF